MRQVLAVLLICAVFGSANADYLVVSRNAQIKATPATNGELIERAEKGEQLTLLQNGKQTNGYYLVLAPQSREEGWIYRTLAKRHAGTTEELESSELGAPAGFDGTNCGEHLKYGVPHDSDVILCREGYAVGYNFSKKVPDWVSYDITNESANGKNKVGRSDKFFDDEEIPQEFRSGENDYLRTGYDRGHVAPSASIDFSRKANDETFLYSNMTPQLPGFNRNMMGHKGVWGAIEDKERRWVKKRGELYIVAGTYFEDGHQTTGNGVGIPSRFFKILFDPGTQEAIAFWMPQDEDTRDLVEQYIESIDQIEAQTGYDFFSAFEDDVEALLESKKGNYADWN